MRGGDSIGGACFRGSVSIHTRVENRELVIKKKENHHV